MCTRVSDAQIETMDRVKADNPRLNNTDMLMAGINLLEYLLKNRRNGDRSYEELINALLIRDDLQRCLAKPDNPQIDNLKNKNDLRLNLKDNEEKIELFL